MCLQAHHVIPRELGEWLFEKYSLIWEEEFDGSIVYMSNHCGAHNEYTCMIRRIIEKGCPADIVGDNREAYRGKIKEFAKNLVKCIGEKYSESNPDYIPYNKLESCFTGTAGTSIYGREYK